MSAGEQTLPPQPRAIYPVIRLLAALALMTLGGSSMFVVVLVLKPVAAEFGVARGAGSLPFTLVMIGYGLGGIMMGRIADLYGVVRPVLIANICIPAGYMLASWSDSLWQFAAVHGLLLGFLGASATMAPLVADISHWFGRRRGLAIAVVISGNYLAGTIWPPIAQYFIDSVGWRETYFGIGVFCFFAMLPLCLVLRRKPPAVAAVAKSDNSIALSSPLGMSRPALQSLLCCAGLACCVAMAMPQVHIVAYATDLGYAAARGAEMLSLMLGFGIASRLLSGWISDHIGGLKTLLLGSSLQAIMLALFIPFDGLFALYLLSALFGLSQGGIVPSYTIILRTYFPPGQAGWRIGAVLLFTMLGMALGGWLAGMLYDLTGSYTAAFINGIGFNLLNLAIAIVLLQRRRR